MRLAGTRMKHHWSRKELTRDTKAGPVWTGDVRFNAQWLDQPLRWAKPRRIFVCAHGDLFAENVPDEWIDRVFAVMALAPQHTFMVLTKRAKRMREYLQSHDVDLRLVMAMRPFLAAPPDATICEFLNISPAQMVDWTRTGLPHVWLGVSVEDQARADERIPDLLATPAAKRFLSCEPLLGPVNLERIAILNGRGSLDALNAEVSVYSNNISDYGRRPEALDWVICGGESGPGARPMHPDWARSLRDQCQAAGVPFFFKQWGEWAPVPHDESLPGRPQHVRSEDIMIARNGRRDELNSALGTELEAVATPMRRVGKHAAGRLLDGREWSELPA